jgi:Ca-activated chloride channel family protein
VQADITNIALDHHLVSKFTSLVAVDVTPSKPGDKTSITKAVANKVKAAKTATNSQLWMMLGLVIILLSVVTRRREQS